MRVIVIKGKRFNTVHIFDHDDREAVFPQKELPQLIMILKKARRERGMSREEVDAKGYLKEV